MYFFFLFTRLALWGAPTHFYIHLIVSVTHPQRNSLSRSKRCFACNFQSSTRNRERTEEGERGRAACEVATRHWHHQKKLGGGGGEKKKLTALDNKFFIHATHPRQNMRAAAAAWRVKCVWIWPANTAEEPIKDAWSHWRGIKNLEI